MRDLALLPKAHLHVHLESAVRWPTLRELAAANGVPLPPGGDGPLRFDGFRAFGDHGSLVRACLRTAGDFHRVAVELCEDEAAQGVRHLEVTFTAASHGERLGDPAMPLEAVLAGLAEGGARHGVECLVLLDHSRRRPVERFRRTLELAVAHDAVAGIGLAGDESHPLATFAGVLAEARAAGLHLVHHAGELAGPASVREALDAGRAERIGHGLRALEDAGLVAELRDRGVPLEVCPSSNVALGVVPSVAAHPLPRMLGAGLAVTLSTDVPAVTGTSVTDEYRLVREAFGLGDAELAAIARAGVDASFAPAATKDRLRAGIGAWLSGGRAPARP